MLSGVGGSRSAATVSAGKLIVTKASALADGSNLTVGDSQYFSAPVVPAALAAAATPLASEPTPAAAFAAAATAPVPQPAFVSAAEPVVVRSAILDQVAATPLVFLRAAAMQRQSFSVASGSVADENANRESRLRDALFFGYGREA